MVADRGVAREGLGEEPLRVAIGSMVDDTRRRMSGRDPLQAHALTLKVDASRWWVPLEEPFADPEREAVQFVSPDQLWLAVPGERLRDARHVQPAEGVLER